MIRIENLRKNYSDFRTLYSRHKHQNIQEALNYYEDNKNVTDRELLEEFSVFNDLDCVVLIDCFQKEEERLEE